MFLLKKINVFLDRDTIASATTLFFISYLVSSILGLLRNRVLANYFGDSPELGVFYLADKLPAFLFSTLILTVLSTSFVPLCVKEAKKNKEELFKFVSNSITLFSLVFVVVSVPVLIFPGFFSSWISWNSLDSKYLSLLSTLLVWDLLSQLLFIITSFMGAFLQSQKKFFVPAINPIVYNFGVIIGVLVFHTDLGIYSALIGMFIGNFLSIILTLSLISHTGYKYRFSILFINDKTKKLVEIASPRFLGILVQRLYILLVGGLISYSYRNPAYLVVYEYANQLQNMPVQAFGNSLSQVLLPTFSELADRQKRKKIAITLNRYLLKLTYFLMPVVCMFFILKIPIIRILYGGDKFSWLGTNLTSYTLAFFSLSIWSQSISAVFFRVFYSFKNSIVPTISSVIGLLLSFILALFFGLFLNYGLWSLALSFSIGSIIQSLYLYFKITGLLGNVLKYSLSSYLKIVYSALITGFILYLLMQFFDNYVFDTTRTFPLIIFTSTVMFLGFFVYFLFLDIVGVKIARNLFIRMVRVVKGI